MSTAKSLCKVLAGAWRRTPPPLDCSAEELARFVPVVAQWERPFAREHEAPERLSAALRRPSKLVKALPKRWPDPLKATLRFGGRFDESARFAYQLAITF